MHSSSHWEEFENARAFRLKWKEERDRTTPSTPLRTLPSSCLHLSAGFQEIQPQNKSSNYVLCDDAGWVVIQRRTNGEEDFNKSWQEYEDGFGNSRTDFFIGLKKLQLFTSSTRQVLHVTLKFDWGSVVAQYDDFAIANSTSHYKLESLGKFTGNACDALRLNVNQEFSTYDQNRSPSHHNCASIFRSGWWYPNDCGLSNLNAPFNGFIRWEYFDVKSVVTKIRPYPNGL
ncbi:fibrinogen-like protein 1 [Drosophila sulfurigaster albostrigata]|uniref:fibrinogen-like protein 1 n=1 Tax=Drosophila sulfurigaster albostrigata TaxID=89887 RepID=UPI002D21D877|nr:fibrinogen-like protein 1 [Drosophila sulfurigaster albostrigata]